MMILSNDGILILIDVYKLMKVIQVLSTMLQLFLLINLSLLVKIVHYVYGRLVKVKQYKLFDFQLQLFGVLVH